MSRKGEAQRAVFYPGMKARENGGINNQTQLSPVGTPSKAAPAALGHPSPVPVPVPPPIFSPGANCNYGIPPIPPLSVQPAPKGAGPSPRRGATRDTVQSLSPADG